MIHVEGAMRPNSPHRPDYMKADVYFPRHLINEDPRYSPMLSNMVQEFIVNIGLPVVERWERCAREMWSLTQGRSGEVPQPYGTQTVPASIPNGSSTFVYYGRSIEANPTSHDVNVNDYDSDTDELTSAELESLALLERCSFLEMDLLTVKAKLTATEDALSESLAREASLRAHLSALQVVDGSRSGTPVRHQLSHHASPLPRTPSTPSRSSSYNTVTISPRVYHAAQSLSYIDGPSSSPNSSPGPLAAPHVEALANYYNFLRHNSLSGFIPSLDTIRKSIPISSWSEQLKHLDIPVDKIDTIMSLMASAR